MDTKTLMEKLGRYKIDTFEEFKLQQLSDNELKKKVHEMSQKLDKFPRKSRHSQEWFEKYAAKYHELQSQAKSLQNTEESISLLLTELDQQKEQALEENFVSLNQHFRETFKKIVDQGSAYLKLVKKTTSQVDNTQRSFPSQFIDSSQQMRLNHKVYEAIKVTVSFTNSNLVPEEADIDDE